MSKLDEYKERIAFLTKLFFVIGGLIVIVIGGLINLYLGQRINEIFWLGISVVPFLAYSNLLVFIHIKKHIDEIGKL
ncbi:MAG: hypothetical protein HFP81_00115 [Methylococcales symbiont of Hymedesmia sp. n. MRB-2018]|nr:MAG: hypothetical protein HFP78_00125 [Methylococcales symbiont of Hymedesmia sp. n. MRB-2018]KAF3984826.1 MAG: hypothetical protein HFP81_00115 [Methylococcales symbiont of Hymedesmia sp. n. MRB-2018]